MMNQNTLPIDYLPVHVLPRTTLLACAACYFSFMSGVISLMILGIAVPSGFIAISSDIRIWFLIVFSPEMAAYSLSIAAAAVIITSRGRRTGLDIVMFALAINTWWSMLGLCAVGFLMTFTFGPGL